MEIESKEKFIHSLIIFLSSLIILIVAIILTIFLLTPSATKQEANIYKQLKHQISQYPKGYELKQLIDVEEGRVSSFLVGLYGRCVEGVAKLSEAIQILNGIFDSLLAASDVKNKSNDF